MFANKPEQDHTNQRGVIVSGVAASAAGGATVIDHNVTTTVTETPDQVSINFEDSVATTVSETPAFNFETTTDEAVTTNDDATNDDVASVTTNDDATNDDVASVTTTEGTKSASGSGRFVGGLFTGLFIGFALFLFMFRSLFEPGYSPLELFFALFTNCYEKILKFRFYYTLICDAWSAKVAENTDPERDPQTPLNRFTWNKFSYVKIAIDLCIRSLIDFCVALATCDTFKTAKKDLIDGQILPTRFLGNGVLAELGFTFNDTELRHYPKGILITQDNKGKPVPFW